MWLTHMSETPASVASDHLHTVECNFGDCGIYVYRDLAKLQFHQQLQRAQMSPLKLLCPSTLGKAQAKVTTDVKLISLGQSIFIWARS